MVILVLMVIGTGDATSEAIRRELGAFLRSRRERLTPARAGLPAGGRRRTPGLRREEVAALAGVGVTWYTWLEQGREITPSEQVLNAIGRALMLDVDERDHLWRLAKGRPVPVSDDPSYAVVAQEHLDLLTLLAGTPACIQSAKFDILASNSSYRFLINDLDAGPAENRNCMVRAFLDPEWRAAYDDYDGVTSRMVGRLRAAMTEHLDDPSWISLLTRLQTQSPLFASLWERHELSRVGAHDQLFHLPRVGDTSVHFTRMWLDNASGVLLTVLQPTSQKDAARLRELAALVANEPAVTVHPKAMCGADAR